MYLFCVFAIILMWEIAKAKGLSQKSKNILIVVSGLILFIFAALRHQYVGRDVPLYFRNYERNIDVELQSALSWFTNDFKDPGYYFTAWAFGQWFPNPQVWIAVISAFYMICVCKVIKRYSVEPCLSFIVFLMLGFYSFSLTGLRQTIAMGITLLAFSYCTDRKLIRFVITILIASLFHKSSLVFLAVYPLYSLKFSKWHIFAILIAVVGFIFFKEQIRSTLFNLLNDSTFDAYMNYEDSNKAYTLTNFFVQGAMLAFTGVYYKKAIKRYPAAILFYNMTLIGVVTQLFASMVAEVFRLSMYFSIANIFTIPMAIHCEEDTKMRQIEYILIMVVLVLYIILRGNINYAFFWEEI